MAFAQNNNVNITTVAIKVGRMIKNLYHYNCNHGDSPSGGMTFRLPAASPLSGQRGEQLKEETVIILLGGSLIATYIT